MKTGKNKYAILYTCIVAGNKPSEGLSLERQEELLSSYCQLRGLDPVFVIREADSTELPLDQREGGAKLLSLIDRRRAGHVVVLTVHTIWREPVAGLAAIRDWRRRGVALHVADLDGQAINTGSALGWLIYTQSLGLAEFERWRTGERLRAERQARRREGRRSFNRPVFGFDLEEGQLRRNAAEQLVITRMRWMRRLGISYGRIAERLNADETPTKRDGRRWYASTVRQILTSELHRTG